MESFWASLVDAMQAGALAAAKDTASQALKDAYSAVRDYIGSKHSGVSLDSLRQEPSSARQRLVFQQELESVSAEDDPELLMLMRSLVEALISQDTDAATTVGVDLQNIRATLDVQIRGIAAEGQFRGC